MTMQTHDRVMTEAPMQRWDADPPQVREGGSPPTIPPGHTIFIPTHPEPRRSLLQTLSLYGCLLQLVALFAALWIITGIIAVIAILS